MSRSSKRIKKMTKRRTDVEDLLDDIDPTNFIAKITNEEDAIKLAERFGLLPNKEKNESVVCDCGETFEIKSKNREKLGWLYVCPCGVEMSPLNGTIFFKSHLSILDMMKLILCFVAGCSRRLMSIAIKKEEKVITNWTRKFRRIMNVVNSNDFKRIRGSVELDETCLCKNKYGRGKLLASQLRHLWIVGFIERESKKRFMTRVFRRNIKYMDAVMTRVLKKGCILYTDKFRTYHNFMKRNPGFIKAHHSVNHKRNFVDPKNKDIHTQTIESNWKRDKTKREKLSVAGHYR